MGYAFISYSSKNQGTADAFRALLKKNGVKTWMAPYDIPAGSEYAEVLYDSLIGCSCLVLLLTGDSQSSLWVKKEVNIAVSNCKPIIPVKLDDIELNSAMKLYLNDQQIVPVRTLDENSEGIRKVLKSIIAITGQTEIAQPASVSSAANAPKQVRQEYKDGVYEGGLVDGKRNGKGKYTWNNGDVYEGDFVQDKRTGKGKLSWSNGDVYVGDFVEGKRSGKGKYTWKDGDVYEGDFVDGKRSGKGKLSWSNGDVYVGDFVEGKRTGKGKYTWKNGEVYDGDFIDGKLSGKGRYAWNSGNVYEGDYVDGKRTGKGKFFWKNGDVYEGDFVEDQRTGNGTYTRSDGTVQQGRFENGNFIG